MEKKKHCVVLVSLAAMVLVLFGCHGKTELLDESGMPLTVYLKNNIHYQDRLDRGGKTVSRGSYANYIDPGAGHSFLPVNTPVTIGNWRGGFTITRTSDGKLILFEYNTRMVTMDIPAYLDLITSREPISLSGLSEKDLQGIKEGKAYPGMTRQGVRMALGYPATHKTPSLEDNLWTYWKNRWVMETVAFDADGKVIEIK